MVDYPCLLRLEWDRGRINLALSMEDSRNQFTTVDQRKELLLYIADMLEQVVIGRTNLNAAQAQWRSSNSSRCGCRCRRRRGPRRATSGPGSGSTAAFSRGSSG